MSDTIDLFRVEIDTSGPAFGESPIERNTELSRILRDLADKLADPNGEYFTTSDGALADSNRVRVGSAWMEEV